MQQKDLYLNSEKWIRLWKGRKESKFILSQVRIETVTEQEISVVFREPDFVKHRLGEEWEAKQERKADTRRQRWKIGAQFFEKLKVTDSFWSDEWNDAF